eukprot:23214_1
MSQLKPSSGELQRQQLQDGEMKLQRLKKQNLALQINKEKVLNNVLSEFDKSASQMSLTRTSVDRIFRVALEDTKKRRQYDVAEFISLETDKAYQLYSDKMR